MGGHNTKEQLIPRLEKAVEELFSLGLDERAEDVEEAIAVLTGRLVLKDGFTKAPE